MKWNFNAHDVLTLEEIESISSLLGWRGSSGRGSSGSGSSRCSRRGSSSSGNSRCSRHSWAQVGLVFPARVQQADERANLSHQLKIGFLNLIITSPLHHKAKK